MTFRYSQNKINQQKNIKKKIKTTQINKKDSPGARFENIKKNKASNLWWERFGPVWMEAETKHLHVSESPEANPVWGGGRTGGKSEIEVTHILPLK